MGKKNKAKRNTKKKADHDTGANTDGNGFDVLELDENIDMSGLTDEQKEKIMQDRQNQGKHHEEDDFESTEDKARSDMEQ